MRKDKILRIIMIIVVIFTFVVPFSFAVYRNVLVAHGGLVSSEWDVTLSQNGVNRYLSIVPEPNGTYDSYTLNITSNSEVDATYSIVVDDLPDGVSVKLDNGSFVEEDNNKVIFADVDTILYSSVNKTKTHVLTFKASSSTSYVSESEINVNVIARQALAS